MLTDGADISPKYNPEPETVEGCVNLWYLIQFWMSKVTYILFDKGLLYFLECNSEQKPKITSYVYFTSNKRSTSQLTELSEVTFTIFIAP